MGRKQLFRRVSAREFLIVLFALFFASCSDPSANKPKATVSNAAPTTQESSSETALEIIAITPANTTVDFVGSSPKDTNAGSFKNFSGQIVLKDKPENSRVTVEIDTNSVQTADSQLTEHLKSPDFFDVKKFPTATFKSTEIKAGGENGATNTVTGNLELHGVTKAITFPATIKLDQGAVSMTSEFAINRKDFGIAYSGPTDNLIRDSVVLKLSVNAQRNATPQK